jgi:cytochrome c-type biogenesis protein CcmH
MSALLLAAALAVSPLSSAPLADPAQERRAEALDMEIRCVVCENEPIAQSTADIAADMRRLVRERIAAGASDEEIRRFFRERYGDFVLLRPPFDARTWALWAAPALLLALGGGLLLARARRSASAPGFEPEDGER